MVPRPGSTTLNDGLTIQEASEAGAQSAGRSPTAREHSERPVASWSSEGTFTTGHGASDNQEGYEEQFAVPDAAPDEGAAKGRDASRGPTSRKPAKADDQQQPTAKAAMKRKSPKRRKKKLRAPDSAEESLSKPQGKDTGRQYTVEEVRYVVARTELFRLLEQDPILVFLKPMLMSNFTGPFVVPDFDSLTSVAHAAPTLFQMLRDSGFVLGAFEMERLAHRAAASPWQHPQSGQSAPSTTTPSPPPRYQSSVDSDSSFESPKRMPMNRPPRVMQLSAAPARTEVTKPAEEVLPKALRESIIKLRQTTVMSAPRADTAAIPTGPPASPTLTVARPQEAADVAMESVRSRSSTRSRTRRNADEDPDDLFDLDIGVPRTVATVSTATAGGVALARVHLSASSELKEFSGRDASEEKARLWLNHRKSAARRDGMTGEEVCGQFSDLMSGPARQWYLQLPRKVKKSWTELMEQLRVQYCTATTMRLSAPDETPLDYLYRLNVAGLRANIPYTEGTTEQKGENVEHFIRTLSTQETELASRLTLMEVADSEALEKKLRARQRGLAHQKKTLFGSNKFRQSRDSDDRQYDQDEADEERAKLFVAGQAPPGEPARRNFDPDDLGRDRPRCRYCGSRRHVEGDCWKLLTCQKCGGQHPTERCLRVCKACGDVHEAGECPMEEFFSQLRQWFDPNKHAGMLLPAAEKIENPTSLNDNTCEFNLERATQERARRISAVRCTTHVEFAREPPLDEIELQPGERRGYWKHYSPHKWYKQAKIHGTLNNRRAVLLLDTGAEVSILDTTFAREEGCLIDTEITQECVGIRDETYYTVGRTRVKITLAGNLVDYMHLWVGDLVGQHTILGMNFMVPAGVRIDTADGTACLPDEVHIQMIGRRPLYSARMHPVDVKTPTPSDGQPRNRGFVRLGSTRYQQWQNLAYGATHDAEENWIPAELDGPMTDRSSYPTPKAFLRPEPRQLGTRRAVTPVLAAVVEAPKARGVDLPPDDHKPDTNEEAVESEPDMPPTVAGSTAMEESPKSELAEPKLDGPNPAEPNFDEAKPDEQEEDDAVLIHEGSDLFAEDLESEMAVVSHLSLTAEVKIEDLKVGMPTGLPPEEAAIQETRLRQIVWKRRKWLIDKGNALSPAALGVVCDIDVGDAKPVVQRVRKIPPQFREKVAHLIKGLLSATMIQKSKSP
ncbi:Eukaryotic/viral aspartic protease, active site, partial [Phytophthora sojae]